MLTFQPAYYSAYEKAFFAPAQDPFEQFFCPRPTLVRRSPSVRVCHAVPQQRRTVASNLSRSAPLFDLLLGLVDANANANADADQCSKQRHQQHYLQHGGHNNHNQHQEQPQTCHQALEHKEVPVSVSAQGYESPTTFQVRIKKSNNSTSFDSYSIIYKQTDDATLIQISSTDDSFDKTYKFAKGSVNVNNVQWLVKRGQLVVTIPKVLKSVVTAAQLVKEEAINPDAKVSPQKETRGEANPADPVTTPQKKVISIPIDFTNSQHDVPMSRRGSQQSTPVSSETEADSATESDSENESTASPLPKLTRKVSIEEVEDESLVQMDLD